MVRLSVVMSVYNGAATLERTLDSIAAQTMADYELIVIDDGSTDATAEIVRTRVANDARIRLLSQSNQGLTRALISGCAAAQADVIARHDCGDVSMSERFAKQLAAMRDDVALVSCFARYVGPEGERLYDVTAEGDAIRSSLLHDDVRTIRGLPHHGTAMFRRDAYLAAGGYRDAFRYAQDVDLWIRIARLGAINVVDEVLYEAAYEIDAISAKRRDDQFALARIAIALRDGASERLLDDARAIGTRPVRHTRRDDARALYFIASCLRRNGDARSRRYAREAVRRDPLYLRAWTMLLR